MNIEIRHSQKKTFCTDNVSLDAELIEKYPEVYSKNLLLHHDERDHTACVRHVGTIETINKDGDNVEIIDDSDNAGGEHVDVAKNTENIGHINDVEHVIVIEHVEDVEQLRKTECERMGGEDDADQTFHVKHMRSAKSAEHIEPETHYRHGKRIDHI